VNTDDARALLSRLLARIAPEIDLAEVDPTAQMQEAMDLDSMDFLRLITALHDETGIEVPEHDYPAVSTIDGFAAYVAAGSAA
jgi:acyl carrier protein